MKKEEMHIFIIFFLYILRPNEKIKVRLFLVIWPTPLPSGHCDRDMCFRFIHQVILWISVTFTIILQKTGKYRHWHNMNMDEQRQGNENQSTRKNTYLFPPVYSYCSRVKTNKPELYDMSGRGSLQTHALTWVCRPAESVGKS